MAELVLSNAFRIVKGHPVTSSREVASHFEKRHNDVSATCLQQNLRFTQTLLKPKIK